MAGIYWAVIAYLVGGAVSVFAFVVYVRKGGCALRRRDWIELSILASILWPLVLLQTISSAIGNRERRARARARGRV